MRHAVVLLRTTLAIAAVAVCATAAADSNVYVVRVGDGAAALSSAAAAVFLERRAADGSIVGVPLALPTAAQPGGSVPFTLSGTASSEGALALSADGRSVSLAGYAVVPGTTSPATSSAATVNRVVARIDAFGAIDTSTVMTTAFSGGNVRGAVFANNAFWVSGGSGTGTGTGGVWYVLLGAFNGTQVLNSPGNARTANIVAGQLYGASGSAPFTNVFTIGTGLPTTADVATSLPGFPTSGASPYAFVLLDLNVAVAGVDTAYVADDRALASGGGIQKWTYDGMTWTEVHVFTNGLSTGVRGLAAEVQGANVVLYATTTEANANTLIRVVDDGSASATVSVIATAPTNTAFRGVALAPDEIFGNGFE